MPSVSEPVTASLLGKNRVQSVGQQCISFKVPAFERGVVICNSSVMHHYKAPFFQ